jgi:hypothetical protein
MGVPRDHSGQAVNGSRCYGAACLRPAPDATRTFPPDDAVPGNFMPELRSLINSNGVNFETGILIFAVSMSLHFFFFGNDESQQSLIFSFQKVA